MKQSTRILVFTGDGKGKTTAALGMALRTAGHDLPVCVIQFLKNDADVGELPGLCRLGVEVHQTGLGFLPRQENPRWAAHQAAARKGLEKARDIIASSRHSLVVLDEVCLAVAHGLLAEADVVDAARATRPDGCLVLTGRGATAGLIDLADTVTEMRPVKHGMNAGRCAQRGVEM